MTMADSLNTTNLSRRTILGTGIAAAGALTGVASLPVQAAESDREITALFAAVLEAEEGSNLAYAEYDEADANARAASPKPPQAIVHRWHDVFGFKQDEFGRPAILSRQVITEYAQPSRWAHMPEPYSTESLSKARRIAMERLAVLDAWETECARQRDIHCVDELDHKSKSRRQTYFDLWNRLEETPAQSITGVAIKLAAMMHWDDGLRDVWDGSSPGELGETMFLAARRDAMRLAGLPHSFGADEPESEYQNDKAEV
jgi:hypothetical protein